MSPQPWKHSKSAALRGYGHQHRKLREQLLKQEPLCRMCQQKDPPRVRAATIADHIIPLAKGGPVYTLDGLQPLCRECHQDKSNADKGHRVKRRISLSGWPE